MVVYIRSRKFCCCVPVRIGVLVLALSAMTCGSFIAIMGWAQVAQLKPHPLPHMDNVALYLHSSVFTSLVAISLFGSVGAFIKQRNCVSAYAIALFLHLGFSIGSGIFVLCSLFKANSQEAVIKCLNGATDDLSKTVCKNGIAMFKGVAVAIYVISWMLQLYAYIIVANYVEQLDDEISIKETRQMIENISNPAPITAYESFDTLGRNTAYAFSRPNQSFGPGRSNIV